MESDRHSYFTASGQSGRGPRILPDPSSTISVDELSFHTPEPLESDYQRVLTDVPDYGEDLSSRILKQSELLQERQQRARNHGETTQGNNHFVTDPDQPKLALADPPVEPDREKRQLPDSQIYNGGMSQPSQQTRQRRQGNKNRAGESTPLLSEQSSDGKCCVIV